MRRQQLCGKQAFRAHLWRVTISKMQMHLDPGQVLELVTSSLDQDKAEDVLILWQANRRLLISW